MIFKYAFGRPFKTDAVIKAFHWSTLFLTTSK